MKARKIRENVYWMGAVDWDRRLFDALIPLPDGTSYNAYLIRGSQKTALVDTVDPTMTDVLMSQLESVFRFRPKVRRNTASRRSGAMRERALSGLTSGPSRLRDFGVILGEGAGRVKGRTESSENRIQRKSIFMNNSTR